VMARSLDGALVSLHAAAISPTIAIPAMFIFFTE
jgi:hypothetical protein